MEKENHFKEIKKMKNIISCLAVFLYCGMASAQNNLTLDIEGVKKNGGKLYISLFNNEETYKNREIYHSLLANSTSETVSLQIALPSGVYLISIYQDNNSNGKLDSNLLGIPKESFGFSNYNGKSVPGNFNKHKVLVNEKTKKITVQLYKL